MDEFILSWNSVLKGFSKERLEFLQKLSDSDDYNLVLLSNTNHLHIKWVEKNIPFYEEFKRCFDRFYLSHKIRMRKPDREVLDFAIEDGQLNPKVTLFIDDKIENIEGAKKVGFKIWHLNPAEEDVTELSTHLKKLVD